MHRIKRHKIKREKPETSSAFAKIEEEHDLAHYIHDRVELMHQVFSVLKAKDIKAMSPECVRRLSIDDLQELCTEELLGISSKRLLAILDGAEPPSDTESSSQSSEHLEAISLDSISSDEELLTAGTKKKHKHKHRDTKSKKQKKPKKGTEVPDQEMDQSKASRAGLTVLELLELQARARAIRAQLQQEQAKRATEQTEPTAIESSPHSSDSEVEIKDEPTEVVVLSSSEEEKPDVKELEKASTTNNKTVENDTTNAKLSTTEEPETTNENHNDSAKTKKKKEKSKKKCKDRERRKKDSNTSKEENKNNKISSPEKEVSEAEKSKAADTIVEDDSIDQNNGKETSNKITKRVNDLIITMPQQTTRKIKLNRNKMTVSVSTENVKPSSVVTVPEKPSESTKKVSSVVNRPETHENETRTIAENKVTDTEKRLGKAKSKEKTKKKPKKKEKRQSIDEDHDEITLQLSDTEKMDLLEDFDRKDYEKVSSSSSDSESSSSESSDGSSQNLNNNITTEYTSTKIEEKSEDTIDSKPNNEDKDEISNKNDEVILTTSVDESHITATKKQHSVEPVDTNAVPLEGSDKPESSPEDKAKENDIETEKAVPDTNEIKQKTDSNEVKSPQNNSSTTSTDKNALSPENETTNNVSKTDDIQNELDQESQESSVLEIIPDIAVEKPDANKNENEPGKEGDTQATENTLLTISNEDNNKLTDRESSEEGEVADSGSSEIEALEVQQEVVCISDDETPKKKKKKDKKSKKEKKQKSDFRESADQNFYKDSDKLKSFDDNEQKTIELDDDDDVFEILELSDDSSCYEVEGITLSKEPTDEEIAALSAKIDEIDEIERLPIITEQEIREHENLEAEKREISESNSNEENIENVCWKDRYLNSKKVKKVLTTSNILNALRKKNKELKRKIEESKIRELGEAQKQAELEKQKQQEVTPENILEEGSIEQYNTLQGSTKYVDPVPDPVEVAKKKAEELKQKEEEMRQMMLEKEKKQEQDLKDHENKVQKTIQSQVTGEMKKDAKLLLKMYKKLFQYNDITKITEKDSKQKKHKKKKKKEKGGHTTS